MCETWHSLFHKQMIEFFWILIFNSKQRVARRVIICWKYVPQHFTFLVVLNVYLTVIILSLVDQVVDQDWAPRYGQIYDMFLTSKQLNIQEKLSLKLFVTYRNWHFQIHTWNLISSRRFSNYVFRENKEMLKNVEKCRNLLFLCARSRNKSKNSVKAKRSI